MNRVQDYYDRNTEQEWMRLELHRIEFAITLRVFREYLPPAPAKILDVGGGAGRYALALAQLGYQVTLFDLSANSLTFAREKANEAKVALDAYIHGNATDLSRFADASFDVALLMGPLYHLLEASERARAASEAQRVLKLGGLIFATFITRIAPIRYAALNDPQWILNERTRIESFLQNGVYVARAEGGFTDAYFAHPSEIKPLLEGAGFQTLDVFACEGVVSMLDRHLNLARGELWDAWVEVNYRLARDPTIHGAAEHLLYVGKKM